MNRYGAVSAAGVEEPGDGHWLEVVQPATGAVWAEVAECSADDIDRVVTAAREAFDSTWKLVDPSQRGRLIAAWADLVEQQSAELAELDMADTGQLRAEALGDVAAAVNWLRYYAGMADKLEGRTFPSAPGRLAYSLREPYGVVAGINAYNATITQFAWKAGPALAAGNAIVVKAPEVAPVASMRMGELAVEAGLPAGVVNVVSGRGHVTGAALADHPGIGKLVFTGNADTAVAITKQAAQSLKSLSFELGGKNAVIALPDVDAELFVPSVLHSNFVKSGQSCAAGSRVFAPASRYDELVEKLARAASAVRVGMPDSPESQMGSLITAAHRDRVDAYVREGVAGGAEVHAGGQAPDGPLADGAFYSPTVIGGVTDDNVLARQELFGPVVGVLRYDDVDEAIARANALDYGLAAQVWGRDVNQLQRAVSNLEAGTVWVNMYRGVHWTAPYGGYKRSGYGRENGFEGIETYTQTKSVVWDLSEQRALPYEPSAG